MNRVQGDWMYITCDKPFGYRSHAIPRRHRHAGAYTPAAVRPPDCEAGARQRDG